MYGSLEPGEIAYGLLSGFVSESLPGFVYGAQLFVRDGFLFMDVDPDRWGSNSFVEGSVLLAREGMESQLIGAALLYENPDFYSLVETEVLVGETVIRAESFTGKRAPLPGCEPRQTAGHLLHGLDVVRFMDAFDAGAMSLDSYLGKTIDVTGEVTANGSGGYEILVSPIGGSIVIVNG